MIVLVLSLVFIFSVVALHSKILFNPILRRMLLIFHSHCKDCAEVFLIMFLNHLIKPSKYYHATPFCVACTSPRHSVRHRWTGRRDIGVQGRAHVQHAVDDHFYGIYRTLSYSRNQYQCSRFSTRLSFGPF